MAPIPNSSLEAMARGKHHLRLRCALLSLTLAFASAQTWAAELPPRPVSQQEYWSQFDRKDWDAAVREAQRLVAATRREDPVEPLRLADVLSMLGNAQLAKGNYVESERAFAEALELVGQHSIPTSSNLLTPLRGLGYALAAGGKHPEAVPVLERALLIAHRSQGLFDIGQQGILRQLAISLTQSGRADEAARHMSYLLRVGQRSFGADDPRLLSILNVVADWHSDTGNFDTARQLYQVALKISEQKLGANHLSAVEPLRGLARTYTEEVYFASLGLVLQRERASLISESFREQPRSLNPRHLSDDGHDALQRAIEILEANPERSASVLTGALIQMGDWHQIKQEPDKALDYYRRAWRVEGAPPEESAQARLSFPFRLYYPMPQSAARTLRLKPEESDERFVQLEFTVTSEGTVKDARVVDADASQRQASDALEAIREARFRPKFVEGAPVETAAVTYREVFRTRKRNGDKEADEDVAEEDARGT